MRYILSILTVAALAAPAHAVDDEASRIARHKAINAATRAYVGEYGVTKPDIDAKYLVAVRKRLLFAMISETCRNRAVATLDLDAFNNCIDQFTKAEKMLGNNLEAPAPKGWPNP